MVVIIHTCIVRSYCRTVPSVMALLTLTAPLDASISNLSAKSAGVPAIIEYLYNNRTEHILDASITGQKRIEVKHDYFVNPNFKFNFQSLCSNPILIHRWFTDSCIQRERFSFQLQSKRKNWNVHEISFALAVIKFSSTSLYHIQLSHYSPDWIVEGFVSIDCSDWCRLYIYWSDLTNGSSSWVLRVEADTVYYRCTSGVSKSGR